LVVFTGCLYWLVSPSPLEESGKEKSGETKGNPSVIINNRDFHVDFCFYWLFYWLFRRPLLEKSGKEKASG
jgi:hypothetical protein